MQRTGRCQRALVEAMDTIAANIATGELATHAEIKALSGPEVASTYYLGRWVDTRLQACGNLSSNARICYKQHGSCHCIAACDRWATSVLPDNPTTDSLDQPTNDETGIKVLHCSNVLHLQMAQTRLRDSHHPPATYGRPHHGILQGRRRTGPAGYAVCYDSVSRVSSKLLTPSLRCA